ncbi:FkbM family methyltransferase [Algibacter luteus]|uniref:Methyltransferase, FkbM family n=1 Tax=Algibacter luteus TaxID=1178825 RepID=A0A1M6ECA5_9FLAO|nr:FkbM family methyltransferase [Algibacter luteus]SHI83105.1 methyltransferase, FkbM family [Algibacter luteus]
MKLKKTFIYKLINRIYQIKWVPKWIYLLGPIQFISLLFKNKFKKQHLIALNVKGYNNPIYLRANTSDFKIFKQIFLEEDHNIDIDFPVKSIIDAGSNCGYSVLYFAKKFENALIIAVEPDESNFNMIKKNTSAYNNVKGIHGGVWSKTSHLSIRNKKAGKWAFQVQEVSEDEGEFKGYSINDIMKLYQLESIDFLKIDIEGSEKIVFTENYSDWLSKTKYGIVELHEMYSKGVTEFIDTKLKEHNFSTVKQGENLIFHH